MKNNLARTHNDAQPENPLAEIVPTNDKETFNPIQEAENMEIHKHPHHVTHKKKWIEYLLEFFMLFLAVFLGFLAENYRETLVNKEKEHHYMQNMVADLKADTADVNFAIYYQQLWNDHLDSALQVPIDRLKDINTQDTFYYHFLPYYCWLQSFVVNDNTITQLKAGGFNFIRNETVVDSINMVYNFYRNASFNNSYNYTCYWDIARKAQELMDMPTPPTTIGENVSKHVLQNKEVFVKYDISAIRQLYSMIRNAQGSSATTIDFEKQYKEKAKRLLTYLQQEYDLK
jgi:hypothetical protein